MSTSKKVLPAPTVRAAVNLPDLKEISETLEQVYVVITGLAVGTQVVAYFHLDERHPLDKEVVKDEKPLALPLTKNWYRGKKGKTAKIYYEVRPGEVSLSLEIPIVA